MEEKKNKLPSLSKKQSVIIIGIFCIALVIFSVSYAVWQINYTQTDENELATGCFQTTFTENTSGINLNNTFPKTDTEGMQIDPYSFTITNTCDIYAGYQVNLEVLPVSNKLDSQHIKVVLNINIPKILTEYESTTPTIQNANISYILLTGGLAKYESITLDLRMWMDENTTTEQGSNKNFSSRISVITSAKEKPLYSMILDSYGGASAIQELPTSTFASVANTEETSGLFKMADDYGTSYYFRGHRDYVNNNVIFAGFQWKIIRINGDGSIRLIYNGTETQFNTNGAVNTIGTNTSIGKSEYNLNRNDNTYVGYKYGITEATNYEDAHNNLTDSIIKTAIDNWYVSNIINQGTEVTNKIVDRIFCNDRQPSTSATTINGEGGYGTRTTYYAAYIRLSGYPANYTPKLTCTQENDKYTVASGRLTYPVGLITADEVSIAGGVYDKSNNICYLHTNQSYWTMTAYYFYGGWAPVFGMSASGSLTILYIATSDNIRPSLNLSSDVTIISGTGSSTNPYRIS